jgi:hypothetical protein
MIEVRAIREHQENWGGIGLRKSRAGRGVDGLFDDVDGLGGVQLRRVNKNLMQCVTKRKRSDRDNNNDQRSVRRGDARAQGMEEQVTLLRRSRRRGRFG